MDLSYGTHYQVSFKDGRLWSFYSDDENNIFYKPLVDDENWADPCLVLSNVKKEFGLNLDRDENLHIICLSNEDEILYIHYDGKDWSKHVLSEYDSRKYEIRYPNIIKLDNRIHIIFAIGSTSNMENWSLCHYCWNHKEWTYQEIVKFTKAEDFIPFHYDIHDRDIHLTYHGISGNAPKQFQIIYSHELHKWSASPDSPLDGTAAPYSKDESDLLEQILDWGSKAKSAYQNHLSIVREVDELHRRSMESKRQWELILDELEHLKADIHKLQKKNPLKSFFKSMLN